MQIKCEGLRNITHESQEMEPPSEPPSTEKNGPDKRERKLAKGMETRSVIARDSLETQDQDATPWSLHNMTTNNVILGGVHRLTCGGIGSRGK